MRTYYIVKGKKGILVGDPTAPGRFVGQRKLSFDREKDELPKRMADRYEPCFAAAPKEATILKAFRNKELEKVDTVVAKNLAEVRTKAQAKNPQPKPAPKKEEAPKPKASKPKAKTTTGDSE